jgi:hypothetical protein
MNRKTLGLFFAIGLLLMLTGCFRHPPVQHLAADASLLTPGKSTRQEVLTYLGEPAEKQQLADNTEMWIYHQVRKSTLREAPYVGEFLGTEEYDVLSVTFSADTVQTVTYRMVPEKDFKKIPGAAAE